MDVLFFTSLNAINLSKQELTVRVITSGCGTAIENLSIFVEKCFQKLFLSIKRNNSFPKGLKLKFQLALCTEDDKLQKHCLEALNKISRNICDHILQAIESNQK